MISFRTTVELGGRTATGFRVPAAVVDELAGGRKPRVWVHVGGHTYRSTVAVYGGEFMLPLSAENRALTGIAAGDEVEVGLEPDTEERTVTVPDDLAAAHGDAGLRESFDALSYTRRKEAVRTVEAAKQQQTRQRRITKVIEGLRP